MKDIYFVKYSYLDSNQPPLRVHNNGNIEVPQGTVYSENFIDALIKEYYLQVERDVVIDFMIKVGETE